MPPGSPPGGFSYIYIFLLCLVGRRGVLTVERRARRNFGRDFAAGWRPEERGAAGLHGGALWLWLVWERGAFALYRGTRHNGGGGAP